MDVQYFNKNLLNKLSAISIHRVTLVEAPAGYGKTAALRHAMETVPAEQVHWYTAVESMQDESMEWFIRQINRLDKKAGSALRELGAINRCNAGMAADILAELRVEQTSYLILDNFQFVMSNWPISLLSALAEQALDGLHVILISQNFGSFRFAMENISAVELITSLDFLLDAQDVMFYGRQVGVGITPQQAKEIYASTEGWAVAVSLYLENLRICGTLPEFGDIGVLLSNIYWEKLPAVDQQMLLHLSPFDHIGKDQLGGLVSEHTETIIGLLARTPMIRYDASADVYYLHEILHQFLSRKLKDRDDAFQNEIYTNAGRWYRKTGETKYAVACFFKAQNYDELLACDLVGLLQESFNIGNYARLAAAVLQNCSESLLAEHPVSALRLCIALFGGADFSTFRQALEKVQGVIEKSGERSMMGECLMVSAFLDFPDLKAMKQRFLQAEALMEGNSQVFDRRDPFLFGSTSMWYLFYTEEGKMMETADHLRDMLAVYNRLTDNHGAGAYELYLGEALSVQGRFDESDIMAHKAALLAEQYKNVSVVYGTALLCGINAIYQSDVISLQHAIEYLEKKSKDCSFLQGKAINRQMVDTVRGYLLGLMMEPTCSAKWTQGEADALDDLTLTNFMVKTNRITDLLLKKEYKRAIASVESTLALDSRLVSLPARNFMYVGLALSYLALGHPVKAAEWLDKSLSIAAKDHNYTFLACFRKYLSVLFVLPGIQKKHGKTIKEIKALQIHYTKAEESHIFETLEKYPEQMQHLSERERQVAELAAGGLRNKEIAERLFISEETVKSHIRSIFNKTNIDRRSQIVELLQLNH